ncbi:MAG: FHA domain-containing protein [Anaerolineae bacterium]|nr:FHA domain-containing protein [Anaerolineae bacterium]
MSSRLSSSSEISATGDNTPEASMLPCSSCGQSYPVGLTSCPYCGALPTADDTTRELKLPPGLLKAVREPQQGEVFRTSAGPIIFFVNGTKLPLPASDNLLIGRSLTSDLQQTSVDLSPFGAREKGVSRRHIKLVDRDSLIYVADLNSSNGTWLNGRRLIAYNEYLLHDGDELRLGLLKIRVSL